MNWRLLPFFFSLILFACQSAEKVASIKYPKKELSEKEEITFGRLYIDASKEKILGNIEKSKELYQAALKIDPSSAAAHYELGLVYNTAGEIQLAFEEFKIANQLDPQNYWYKLSYATFLESQGSVDEAIQLFKELADENSDLLEIKYELSKLLLNQGKIEEGIAYLNQIEEEIGVNQEISFLKQRIYLSLNDVDKAANEIEELIKAFPAELEYYNILANIYLSNDRIENAREVLARLEQKDISNPEVQFSLAKVYLRMGDEESYKKHIFPAFASEDLEIDIKIKFILGNYQLGADQKAKLLEATALSKVITETHPDNAKSHALYADFLYFVDRDQEAMEEYKKTISLDSSRYPVWNQLLIILSENEETEQLLDYGKRSINLFPNQATLYLLYGLALSSEKQYEEAIDILEVGKDLAIENQALKSQFYSSLGDLYHELENHISSDKSYEKALQLDPNNVYVLNNYSYYLSLRKENLQKAKEMSLKSNMIAPGQSSFQDTYAWILYQIGEYKDALVWINKAISSDSNASGVLLEHKGDILYKLDQKEEALDYWKQAMEKGAASELIEKKVKDAKLYE